MDKIIEQIAEADNNPGMRDDLVRDLWNSAMGKEFDSPEAIDAALSAGTDVRVISAARQWLGLPLFE
ncbi:MAG: hypothetical protein ACRETN_07620 [Nevskiales bacterium]